MLWLSANLRFNLCREEPDDHVLPWRVDVRAWPEAEPSDGERDSILVGRLLADELRRGEMEEWGESIWRAADADSWGLVEAYTAMTDERGQFRESDFDTTADPFVYLHGFALHPDFSECKLAVLDGFCRLFSCEAVILTGTHGNWITQAEFEAVGFRHWTPKDDWVEPTPTVTDHGGDLSTLMVRDNSLLTSFKLSDYPQSAAEGRKSHAKWVRSQLPIR